MMRGFRSCCAAMLILSGLAFNAVAQETGDYCERPISPGDASKIVQEMVNNYFIQKKNASVSGVPTQESGLYKVKIDIGGQEQVFYLTKDGKMMVFPGGLVDIAKFEEDAKKQKEVGQIPKKDRPTVELFVMSMCPYGTKAEKELLPVANSFGDKIDFSIKYIVNVNGATIEEVESLHGIDEVREDLRQAAIFKYYPEKFLAYLEKMEAKACLISCGELKIDDYWKEAAAALQMDTQKIGSFVGSQEAMDMLKQDSEDAKKYTADASPTLVINGVKSASIYSGAKTSQDAICSAFTSQPDNCKK